MGDISRRNFIEVGAGMMGAMGMAAAFGTKAAQADVTESVVGVAEMPEAVKIESVCGWEGTPEEIAKLGSSTMPLADINTCRQAYLDKQTDYTCEDGTVIPAWAVKVRALIHTYGMGCGSTPADNSFDDIMATFDEDKAAVYLAMPMGIKFKPLDVVQKTGKTLEECEELCEYFAGHGYLLRTNTTNGVVYHQLPFFQGVVEYHLQDVVADPTGYNLGVTGSDMLGPVSDMSTTGTPTFYAMPCEKSVVADTTVLPFDDVEAIIKNQGKFAIAPCYCRYTALLKAGVEGVPSIEDFATGGFEEFFSSLCDQRVETCLMLGEEADYWIWKGIAREITQDEALAYMKRSADDGFILESCFSKDTGTICSCHADSCGIIAEWMSLGGAAEIGASKPFEQISHYNLDVDFDACLKCGTCEARCPLHAITMDAETGLPTVNEMCFRCGQCAYVCPAGARKLVARPAEMNAPLPQDFLDDDNVKAGYRFEHGLII